MIKDDAVASMKRYFADNSRYINHTLKVLSYAEQILEEEAVKGDFFKQVTVLSSIYHDIGIPESEKKYSSSEAEYQEKEGPPIARKLMERLGIRADVVERVLYIVGNHHTKERVDGIDFQILWEADFLVNIEEKNFIIDKDFLSETVRENFSTDTGNRLINNILEREKN
jgi:hypothetical protein